MLLVARRGKSLSANTRKALPLEVGRLSCVRVHSIEGAVDLAKLFEFTLATGARIQVMPDLCGLLGLKTAQDESCQVGVDLRELHLMTSREESWTTSSLRKLL